MLKPVRFPTIKPISKSVSRFGVAFVATFSLMSCSDGNSSSDSPGGTEAVTEATGISSPPTSFDLNYRPINMVTLFEENQLFSTFAELVALTDLAPLFETEGEITVFVPANVAFERLPEGTIEKLKKPENRELLTRILAYHMLDGKVLEMDIEAGTMVMKSGDSVSVEVGSQVGYIMNIRMNGVVVLVGDLFAGNSVAHALAAVLIPTDVDLSSL